MRRDERTVHDRQAPVQAALALSNQRRVAASVQPGTAKRPGSVMPWLGRTMTCWRVRKYPVGGLEPGTFAASADAHSVINRLNAKTFRIPLLQATYFSCHVIGGLHRRNL
jgi:hypothetical protein